MKRVLAGTAAAHLAIVPASYGQPGPPGIGSQVGSPIPLHPFEINGARVLPREPVIALSRTSSEVLVLFIDDVSQRTIRYSWSEDGTAFSIQGDVFDPGFNYAVVGDPLIAFSAATGVVWCGGVGYPPGGGAAFVVASKAPGAGNPLTYHPNPLVLPGDRPMTAAGPRPPNWDAAMTPPEVLHMLYYKSGEVWGNNSTGAVLGASWDAAFAVGDDPSIPDRGVGVAPFVIQVDDTSANVPAGRLGVAFKPELGGVIALPRIRVSDNGGLPIDDDPPNPPRSSWSQAADISQARIPGSSLTDDIIGIDDEWNVLAANQPSAATDPTMGRYVYVVFSGRWASEPTGDVDVFVAQSIDGGLTFPASNTIRLTDAAVGCPSGSAQFLPAVSVDGCGYVNVLFHSVTDPNTSQEMFQARWARIARTDFGNPQYPIVSGAALAPAFPRPSLNYWAAIGDYQWIDSRDEATYPVYVSGHELFNGVRRGRIYTNRIQSCPLAADVNFDNEIDSTDVSLFGSYYAGNDQRADVNRDGVVSITDVNHFAASYACQCNP